MTKKTEASYQIFEQPPLEGGAWKVAYADFVTAMMAFFLLLWLLNSVTQEEKEELAAFFDPSQPIVSEIKSGAGGVLGGLSMTPQGAMAENQQPLVNMQRPQPSPPSARKVNDKEAAIEEAKKMMKAQEERQQKDIQEKIEEAVQSDPELANLQKNLKVDVTPEGLRIQIVDQDGEPMFPSGSARMFEKTKKLMGKIAGVIQDLPNKLSVRGHTDSIPFGGGGDYTNWNLSSDRALETRNVLVDAGIPQDRVSDVVGKADTDPLLPENPADPQNRRISIILLNEEITNPEEYQEKAEEIAEDIQADNVSASQGASEDNAAGGVPQPRYQTRPVGTFQKSPGNVEFP